MTLLHVMMGLPGSGKSTKAQELSEQLNALVLSSDKMREELFGDENDQDHQADVFAEIYRRAKGNINNGLPVIIDATNISAKRRKAMLEQLGNPEAELHFVLAHYYDALDNNVMRNRIVPKHVIDRMYKQLNIPFLTEGWSKINLYVSVDPYTHTMRKWMEKGILEATTHDELYYVLASEFSDFEDMIDLAQDTPYHTLSVSRHTWEAFKHVRDNYQNDDPIEVLAMLWFAILHDAGKPFAKEFKQGARYANFINHENVSAQLAIYILSSLGYTQQFVLKIAQLVEMHMKMYVKAKPEKALKIQQDLINKLGQKGYEQLKFFHEADISAK